MDGHGRTIEIVHAIRISCESFRTLLVDDTDDELVVIELQQFWDSSIPNLSYTVSPNIIAILFHADSDIDSFVSEIDGGKICRHSIPSSVVHTVIIQDTSQK